MDDYTYAVVKFLDGEEAVSEVPIEWLDDENNCCWWPPTKNVASYLAKRTIPNKDTWLKYRVKLESLASKW